MGSPIQQSLLLVIYIYISLLSHYCPQKIISPTSPPQKTHLPTSWPGDIKGYENRLALDAKSQLGRAKDLAPRRKSRGGNGAGGCNGKNHIFFLWNKCDTTRKHGGFDGDLSGKNRMASWFVKFCDDLAAQLHVLKVTMTNCVDPLVLSLGKQRFMYPYPCLLAPGCCPTRLTGQVAGRSSRSPPPQKKDVGHFWCV